MALRAHLADHSLMNDMPESLDDARFAAVLARNAVPACGAFLYAVTSQGIYCRPGCPSPAPLRRHVRFFADWGSAEAAGFRPCKRCDPRGDRARLQAEAVRAACAMIEAVEGIPSLASLAARAGYAPHFAGGILVSAGTLGILIPPSLAFVVYGVLADASIPRLFLAGVIPGLISAGMMGVYVYFFSRKNGYVDRVAIPMREKIQKTVTAIPALMVPVIVLGGLYGGFVTLTETAALSAVVAIILALFVYREVKVRDFLKTMTHSVRNAAGIMIIIATALAFGHLITETGVAQKTLELMRQWDIKPWQFLLAINILLIFLGMFLEVFSILLIVVPILIPLLAPLGIDPIHFGVMLVINMELALMSPPVGLNLFVISNISNIPLAQVLRGTMPFFILMVGLLMVITYIPVISTWLPDIMMGTPK